MSAADIITTAPERRQIAKVIDVSAGMLPYTDWRGIATTARELGSHFEARSNPDNSMTITFFWSYTDAELTESRTA